MTSKKYTIVAARLLLLVIAVSVWAQGGSGSSDPAQAFIGSTFEIGVGARAMAFGGNHVAAANNLSAVYWNPAALAFLPVREMHVAFDGFRIRGESSFDGRAVIPRDARLDGNVERLRMPSIGVVHAIPTTSGGLTIAFSRDEPVIFDDLTVYTFIDVTDGETTHIDSRVRGNLNRWSGALGIQIAPNISLGATLSYTTGLVEGKVFYSDALGVGSFRLENEYKWGFSAVIGAMYLPADNIKVGLKINAISVLRLEDWTYLLNEPGQPGVGFDAYAYSAPSGSAGIEYKLPWATLAADLRLTMPFTLSALSVVDISNMPDDIQAKTYKVGAGIGLEVPLPDMPVVIRAGYSFDDYDIYPMIIKYDDYDINWGAMGTGAWPNRNRHTLGLGLGAFTAGMGFELSYAYQTWGIRSDTHKAGYKQDYSSHRFMTAFTYRY